MSAIEEAARAWSLALTQAGTDLSEASHKIQATFADSSAKLVSSGKEEIPDPIKLLRRIAALESAVVALRKESSEVRQKRNQISVEVTDLLCQNAQAIDQMSRKAKGPHESISRNEEELDHEWDQLARDVLRENEVYQSKRNTESNNGNDITENPGRIATSANT
eukprot:CAMPEP_0198294144 /NCGR_PEP_ID=MMETSP1449-20131203/21042_1 /TAXON_ID=420275 /ORGANISM="Attheya septentrionalis, Strain CCMP2084" /LENGTH=163 /DNA_ID=CAMNT_0043994015 /DNA_START=14 /DNA_END=505 /DNA_ORIENTATION=+